MGFSGVIFVLKVQSGTVFVPSTKIGNEGENIGISVQKNTLLQFALTAKMISSTQTLNFCHHYLPSSCPKHV